MTSESQTDQDQSDASKNAAAMEARMFLATEVLCRDELLWEKTLCQNDYS